MDTYITRQFNRINFSTIKLKFVSVPCFLVLLDQEVVEALDILKLAVECGPENGGNTNCVLVNHLDRLLRVHHIVPVPELHFLELDFKVAGELLPADLDIGPSHDARPANIMASDDPTVPTPTAASLSPRGALKRCAIMFTQRFWFSQNVDR
ncbi:pyridoxal phosphate (PLP)-dependent transferasessuperfamily protein [Striga asiatica]|uniref:Pyridoxal phosphate (PLP)-dependent transferasessuperfamily protein n=1 Tax=Striga asiatica TaxID=4170 RepID=A0A5A7QP85_STRAF|nr:pyridoxal phosphate (PLP)-dependent transferasessuperfamily protein [Striga asiatica]